MGDNKKIFDDFPAVDCNECESWWLNQCDGVKEGSTKPCTAFKATRRVNIPLQIESLTSALKRTIDYGLLGVIVGLLWLVILTGVLMCG